MRRHENGGGVYWLQFKIESTNPTGFLHFYVTFLMADPLLIDRCA